LHMNVPEERSTMRRHCYEIYQGHFARERVIDGFDQELCLLTRR
jgi:hypothetical protein